MHSMKVAILGDRWTGKSSIVHRFQKKQNEAIWKDPARTISVTYITKDICDASLKLQLWNISGNRRCSILTPTYLLRTDIFVLVFDVTNYESFLILKQKIQTVRKSSDGCVPIFLVGNKKDAIECCTFSVETAKFASDNGLLYRQTSAKTGEGVQQLLQEICIICCNNLLLI